MSDHDVLLIDLDGTVYRGPRAIDGAVEALEKARSGGIVVSYVTNNASRTPQEVAAHLAELGLTATGDDVVTSAQAAAAVLAGQCDPGAGVLVLGTEALAHELRAVGLRPVREAAEDPDALVQGHSPETGWRELAEASLVLHGGGLWVACNVDPTLPSDRGLLPGNGSMVALLRTATGREPQVAGKPAPPLLRQAVARHGARSPLVVGDRLDTDIAGARAVDADALFVLTGVSTAGDLLAAGRRERPTHVAADLAVLDADLDAVRVDAPSGWSARAVGDGVLALSGEGDDVSALRALCAARWSEDPPGGSRQAAVVQPDGEAADAAITALGLPRA